MRVQLNRNRDDRGAVAILVAILATVLVVIAAFTTDFGMAYAQRQALQTGADSAALAVVRAEYEKVQAEPSLTCSQLRDDAAASAPGTALQAINDNAPFGIQLTAADVSVDLSCVGMSSGTLKATVGVSKTIDTIFGGVIGISTLSVGRGASAALGVANGVTGALPLAICTAVAQSIVEDAAKYSPQRPHELVDLAKVWKASAQCGTSAGNGNGNGNGKGNGSGSSGSTGSTTVDGSGNWGWLYCDGNGAPALAANIAGGCSQPITLNAGTPPTVPANVLMSGTPGDKVNSQQVIEAMQSLINKDGLVAIPVYDQVSGQGAGTQFRIIGFLSAKVCGIKSNSKAATGTCYLAGKEILTGQDVSLTDNSLQIIFSSYAPVSDLSSVCALGNSSCSFNAFVTKLVQ